MERGLVLCQRFRECGKTSHVRNVERATFIKRVLCSIPHEFRRDHIPLSVPQRNDISELLGADCKLGNILRLQVLNKPADMLGRRGWSFVTERVREVGWIIFHDEDL